MVFQRPPPRVPNNHPPCRWDPRLIDRRRGNDVGNNEPFHGPWGFLPDQGNRPLVGQDLRQKSEMVVPRGWCHPPKYRLVVFVLDSSVRSAITFTSSGVATRRGFIEVPPHIGIFRHRHHIPIFQRVGGSRTRSGVSSTWVMLFCHYQSRVSFQVPLPWDERVHSYAARCKYDDIKMSRSNSHIPPKVVGSV